MKKIKYLILSLSATLAVGCSDFEDTNVDPNNAVSVDPSTLLTEAQFTFYSTVHGRNLNADWGQLMVQYWSQNEYTSDSRYSAIDVTSFNGTFGGMYTNVLKELNSAKELVENQEVSNAIKTNRKNILDVITAQVFGVLTDGFGDVPYSEAISDISLPKYDSQQEIYNGLLATLDNAAQSFSTSNGSFDSGDVIYNGDVASWRKLTNSLLLRFAMRIADVDATTASNYVNRAINRGVFTSNADNATFTFDSNINRANPLHIDISPNGGNRDDHCVSEYLVTTLENMGDPRLQEYAAPASGGTIVGMPYGLSDNDATVLKPTTSRPSDQVREATTPFYIITYSEVQFLLAEAYERGFLTGSAANAYAEGITASMNRWGITDATAIANYIAANPYNAANWKESIGVQKWVSLYMNGVEAWSEWRRLDYPVLAVPADAEIPTIPVKLPYPLSETQTNSSQLGQVSSDPGSITTKVWWDVN
jgi:hypothetical protein